jgi:hypothetical protein
MRFMMIVKASPDSEAGVMPSEGDLAQMGAYNAELAKAGILRDGMGLQSSAKGARVYFEGDKKWVVDGPFAETKELIAGFWLIEVSSKQEAIDWALKAPNPNSDKSPTHIELRQVFEMEDFGESPAVEEMKKLQTGSLS